MNDKIILEVLKRLDLIGLQMKITGTKLSEEAIKYTYVQNICGLILDLLFIVLFPIISYFILKKIYEIGLKIQPKDDNDDFYIFLKVGYGVAVLMLICTFGYPVFINGWYNSFPDIPEKIAGIASPTWAVVKTLIGK